MSAGTHRHIVKALLEEHGRTFCDELGIDIEKNTPSPLFQWLCASILLSARIRSDIAVSAAQALARNGWTTPEKMADSTWECRTRTLNCAGYARYDESTARMLKDTTSMLLEEYRGDLRVLRDAAEYDPAGERRRLIAFKGMGEVGVDIFFREVQTAWDELYPFADKKALKAAHRLGLPTTAEGLAALVSRKDYPRLLAALVRTDLDHDYDAMLHRAAA
ncbi:MAG: hypothetical protein ACTHJ3_18260 [Pararhizobium sp.]